MLLRRFTKHLTEQNWFTVGLDVTVLVMGIFLGFQLESWNEERKDKATENRYLERLYSEAVFNLNEVKVKSDQIEVRKNSLLKLVRALENGSIENISREDLKINFCYWYVAESVRLRATTYEELIASSNIDIISNESLREKLQYANSAHKSVEADVATLNPVSLNLALNLRPYISWHSTNTDVETTNFDRDSPLLATCKIDTSAMIGDKGLISTLTQLYRGQFILQFSRLEQLKAWQSIIDEF